MITKLNNVPVESSGNCSSFSSTDICFSSAKDQSSEMFRVKEKFLKMT